MVTRCLSHRLALLILSCTLWAGCSPLKYNYYFSHNTYGDKAMVPGTPSAVDSSGIDFPELAADEYVITGSTNNLVLLTDVKSHLRVPVVGKQPGLQLGKDLFKEKEAPVPDKAKNWTAIAGLLSVVAGIIGYAVPLWPLVPVGVVLCIIGLKSEKRGWAVAGVVTGVVAILAVLIFIIANGFYRQITTP